MAVTIARQESVNVNVGISYTLFPPQVGRKVAAFQIHGRAREIWVSFGGTAAQNAGLLLEANRGAVDIAVPGNGNNTDFYEGAINVFIVPLDSETPVADTIAVWVVEAT